MVELTVNVHESDVNKVGADVIKVQGKALELVSKDLISNLQKNSPVDHAILRRWAVTNKTDTSTRISTPAMYARYVNEGTGIYGPRAQIIRRSNNKPFVFEVDNEKRFTRTIKGQKPRRFVEKSLETTRARLQELINLAIMEVK